MGNAAWQGFDSLQQQGRNHEEKPLLSSCWVLECWSVCLNELLTLHIKLHQPFYFQGILLIPNIFALWVLSWFFPVLGHFPANGLCSAHLCFLLPLRGCVSLLEWHWQKCPVSLGNAVLWVLCWVWRSLEDLGFVSFWARNKPSVPVGQALGWGRPGPFPVHLNTPDLPVQTLSQPLIS